MGLRAIAYPEALFGINRAHLTDYPDAKLAINTTNSSIASLLIDLANDGLEVDPDPISTAGWTKVMDAGVFVGGTNPGADAFILGAPYIIDSKDGVFHTVTTRDSEAPNTWPNNQSAPPNPANGNYVLYKKRTSTAWSPFSTGLDVISTDEMVGRVTGVSRSTGQIDLFARKRSTNQIATKAFHPSSLWWPSTTGWHYLTPQSSTTPNAVATAWNDLWVFGKSVPSGGAFYVRWQGGSWPTYGVSLSGTPRGEMAAVSREVNGWDLFMRDYATEQICTKHRYPAGTYTNWQCFGESFKTTVPPTVVSWSANRMDVFGVGTNNQVIHVAWNSTTGWATPVFIGGDTKASVAAVSRGLYQFDLFITDRNSGSILTRSYYDRAGGWTPWSYSTALAGDFSSVSAVAQSANRLDVLTQSVDGDTYWKWWDGTWH